MDTCTPTINVIFAVHSDCVFCIYFCDANWIKKCALLNIMYKYVFSSFFAAI